MKIKHALIIINLAFTFSCESEEIKIDPKKAILGKWEITHNSFGPVENPIAYEEYLPDSVLLIYNYKEGTVSNRKYWMRDSLLFRRSTYFIYEGPGYEDTVVFTDPYQFEFLTRDKLKLEFQYSAMNTTFIYKRIK